MFQDRHNLWFTSEGIKYDNVDFRKHDKDNLAIEEVVWRGKVKFLEFYWIELYHCLHVTNWEQWALRNKLARRLHYEIYENEIITADGKFTRFIFRRKDFKESCVLLYSHNNEYRCHYGIIDDIEDMPYNGPYTVSIEYQDGSRKKFNCLRDIITITNTMCGYESLMCLCGLLGAYVYINPCQDCRCADMVNERVCNHIVDVPDMDEIIELVGAENLPFNILDALK